MILEILRTNIAPCCYEVAILLPHAVAVCMMAVSLHMLARYRRKIKRKENPFPKDTTLHRMVENEYEAFYKSETAATKKLMRTCQFVVVQAATVTLINVAILNGTVRSASCRLLVFFARIASVDLSMHRNIDHVLGNAFIFIVFLLVVYSIIFLVSASKKAIFFFVCLAALHLHLATKGVFTSTSLVDSKRQWSNCLRVLVQFAYIVGMQYLSSIMLIFSKKFDVKTLPEKMQKIVEETGFYNKVLKTCHRSSKINALYLTIGFFKPICFIGDISARLSVEDISGILCHEIGHAQDTTLTLVHWIFMFAHLAVIVFIPHVFAKVGDAVIAPSSFRAVTVEVLYYVNFLSVVIACSLLMNIFLRRCEYFADRYSYEKVPEYDIRKGLFHLSLCNETPIYMPLPFVILFSGHPSAHMRILALKKNPPARAAFTTNMQLASHLHSSV